MNDLKLTKPDNLTDQEWEDMLEDDAEIHALDHWDTLELLRKALNSSHIEAMHHLKKHSKYGKHCPYYIKAKTLFEKLESADILSLLDKLNKELENK